MIKLESGNPPLQLGKAVCNSADYPLVKQYAASFLMLQRREEQRETRRGVVPRLPPASPGDRSHWDKQNWYPKLCHEPPSPRAWTPSEPLHPCLSPAVSPMGASLAKLGVLQEQQVLW